MGDSQSIETSLYGFEYREPDKRRERENEDGSRRYDIKQLWQRSHEILNLALLGYKQTEIANMLSITPQTVCNTLNSSLGMEALSDRRKGRDEEYKGLRDEVMELTKMSLATYRRILEAESDPTSESFDPEVPLKMKKDTADTVVLELSGMRVPTKVDSRSMSFSLTSEEILDFKKRGMEAAKAAGKLVEVEGESKS